MWISTLSINSRNTSLTISNKAGTAPARFTQDGQDGGPGPTGPRGPGVTFRGVFSTSAFYVNDGDIRDVVEHPEGSGNYYAVNIATTSSGQTGTQLGTPPNFRWLLFNRFAAVATDILLADNATIKKTLIMGDQTGNIGVIRSNGATSQQRVIDGDDQGFFFNGDGSIAANLGFIGGFTISPTSLIAGDGTTRVGMSPGTNDFAF